MNGLRSHANPHINTWNMGPEIQHASFHYRLMRRMFQVTVGTFCGVRVFNRHVEPTDGSCAYICNHQSFLDPMLVGFALRRPLNYMARDTLFHIPIFGAAIASVYAFPVRRNTADTGALKEAMRRLKNNGQVVVFAEGTRTSDGRIGPLLPGVALLAQRAAKWTIPVVIDGAYEAWPRTQLLPGRGNIVVQYGTPIPQEQARAMTGEQFITQVRDSMIQIQADVRRRVGRPAFTYD